MLLILLSLSVCGLAWMIVALTRDSDHYYASKGWTPVFVILTFVLAMLFGTVYFSPKSSDDVQCRSFQMPLRALRMTMSTDGVSGTFFLGCGSVSGGGDNRYFWWYEMDGNRAAYKRAPHDRVYLVEDGGCYVEYHVEQTRFSLWDGATRCCYGLDRKRRTILHIPVGSILEAWEVQ